MNLDKDTQQKSEKDLPWHPRKWMPTELSYRGRESLTFDERSKACQFYGALLPRVVRSQRQGR